MSDRVLIFYGSYRADRQGIKLARYLVKAFAARGADAELIDAKAVDLPILDRMYKEYPADTAPERMEALAGKIRAADAFVFVTGEYNWGVQPGLKNLTDHFLEEWFWRPAAIASYSAGRSAGVRAGTAWHGILAEMGMVVVSARSPWAGSAARSMLRANRPGRAGPRLRGHFRASPTISPGGPRRRGRNAHDRRRHIDAEPKRPDIARQRLGASHHVRL